MKSQHSFRPSLSKPFDGLRSNGSNCRAPDQHATRVERVLRFHRATLHLSIRKQKAESRKQKAESKKQKAKSKKLAWTVHVAAPVCDGHTWPWHVGPNSDRWDSAREQVRLFLALSPSISRHPDLGSRSLSDLEFVGCKAAAAVHFSPSFCPIAVLWGCQSGKNCPRWGRFRDRRSKPDRLLACTLATRHTPHAYPMFLVVPIDSAL